MRPQKLLKIGLCLSNVRTVLGACPDVSLFLMDNHIIYLFISFSMIPISSQSDIWAESYDRNTRGRPDGLIERPDGCTSAVRLALPRIASGREHHIVRTVCSCLPISMSETETLLLVELWMASRRYCHVVRMDALEHWILLKLLIASRRFSITSGRMQSWTVWSF
jgi:hypothetical protein